MTSFMKWKKQTSVLSNQEEDEEAAKENEGGMHPNTPPPARSKRSNSFYALFSKEKAAAPVDDAPTPQNNLSLVDGKDNQLESELETPSLLKPQKNDKKSASSSSSTNFFQGTNKWIETTKRRLSSASAAVIPRRASPVSPNVDTERYVGEYVHTAGGAGVVTEVKNDGSAVVRLVSSEYVNCSMVVVENGGEIEQIPALPQDTVITIEGVGTVINYNPKTKEYMIETLEKTVHTLSVDQVHPMEKNDADETSTSTSTASSTSTSSAPLRSSFLQKMSKFPQLLRNRSLGTHNGVKYHAGQAVMTDFGDGIVVSVHPSSPNTRPVIVVQMSFGGTAFLQVDAIKQGLKASVGDSVQTRFGHGTVIAVPEEQVFLVNVDGEEIYVHASEVTKDGPKIGLFKLFKK
ncbi:hypothetical protein LEN26_015185 [Aphanomyces euteiches]|nr:hypothetical protein LEN26_015185 [Aphanomyces euteiches]KAH9112157.1 hypothetical protein AeMF1_013475 [Aphanomyces euteiches]KAH9184971.1 hypothetical protein AeNC1_013055 [Aphanomyces euteiches]